MERAAKRGGNEQQQRGDPPQHAPDHDTLELCPRCGTEYCVGCGNAERPEDGCPNCRKALRPAGRGDG
jgi:hypothetical protein